MKISNPKTPSHHEVPDIPDDASWIDAYIEPRDDSIKELVKCLQQKVTFADNINSELFDLEVNNNQDITLELKKLKGRPIGATLLWTSLYENPSFRWEILDQNKIRFAVSFASIPTITFKVKLLVIGS